MLWGVFWGPEAPDILSDPPFAGWARNFHDRPAYPQTVVKKPPFKDYPLASLFRCLQYLQATKQRSLESANVLLLANIAPFLSARISRRDPISKKTNENPEAAGIRHAIDSCKTFYPRSTMSGLIYMTSIWAVQLWHVCWGLLGLLFCACIEYIHTLVAVFVSGLRKVYMWRHAPSGLDYGVH